MFSIDDTNFHFAIIHWSSNGPLYGDITTWDTSGVTNMSFAFSNMESFNEDISGWNMSNVTNTEKMFFFASAFNQPLNSWNMGNVTTTKSMFEAASAFNQPLNSWNMEEVTTTESMFASASAFNQDINNWYTPKLKKTDKMLSDASSFNKNINNWYVANVTSMESMFSNNSTRSGFDSSFNQPLNLWNMRNVKSTKNMFEGASAFNQDISSWVLLSLADATSMFEGATDFSQNLHEWGNLPNVNLTDFSLNSNAILGNGSPVWISEINNNISTVGVDEVIQVRESIATVSEGVPFMSGPRYGYISIDDHQTNTRSEFQVVYGDSVRDDKIMARINLAPRSIHTLSLRDARMASLANKTRTYTGPVDIKKLTIKLYDEYGRIIDLNNTDWSFTLEFEKEIKRLVAPAYDSNDA